MATVLPLTEGGQGSGSRVEQKRASRLDVLPARESGRIGSGSRHEASGLSTSCASIGVAAASYRAHCDNLEIAQEMSS
jgi:hypothetical protein